MDQFSSLVFEMSPYLLLGFLLAGLMHAFIPGKFFGSYLAAGRFRSVVNAALFGIPLPLCSCGVIPTAMSLRKEGASRGAVVSFLIATPQTGVDSIIATYGLMGLPFALVRPLAALCTALLGGFMATTFDGKEDVKESHQVANEQKDTRFWHRLVEALRYGFVDMMQDIGRWLVLGLLVAALITTCVPTEWFTVFQGNTWASMLLVLCVSIPMYVCATGSIPIAVALMLKGLTPGAALVLLMAGPACNLASILVVRKGLGWRSMVIYLASIIVGAVAFGCLIDFLQFQGMVDFTGQLIAKEACCMQEVSWVSWASTVLLALLLFHALVIDKIKKRRNHTINPSENMKVYHIEGMNCNHCRMSAEKAILSVEGVTTATVCLETGEAHVEGTASDESIRKAVDAVGFKCTC